MDTLLFQPPGESHELIDMQRYPQKYELPYFCPLYVGHISNLAGCKSRHTPSWQEVLATGKGVVREGKLLSEGSHQQKRCNDAQKLDTGLHSGWQAGNGLRKP